MTPGDVLSKAHVFSAHALKHCRSQPNSCIGRSSHLDPPTFSAFRWAHARLYESHLAELIGRLLSGGDLTMPTAAELLLACSEASLRAPLNRTGFELYETIMREVLGDHPVLATIPLSPAGPLTGMA